MNIMKQKYSTILLLVLLVTSCQDEHISQDSLVACNEMTFNLVAPGVKTKMTDDTFEASDRIGVYVTDWLDDATPMPLQISGNRANNVALTYDGSLWTPSRTIYWGEGKSDVYACYPYISEITDINDQHFEVASDQTTVGDDETLGGYEASDLLWAKAEGVSQADGAVNLEMKHILSKLTVKIVAGEDYIGSLPEDASVLLHSTVTGARFDIETGAVAKDPYSGSQSIMMRNLGIRTYDDVDAVVYEAIVVPQLLETSVPFLEINSKSVSYLLEDSFNFRPGIAYTYTVTLNTSTAAIKVEIGCELEDWNNIGDGDSGDSGEGDDSGDSGNEDLDSYVNLSAEGTANCYLVSSAGNYRFKAVIGNTDATVGNVKSVDVLWESFGTDVVPNVGDLVASVSYSGAGYICFVTPDVFAEGNAVIAARNTAGTILWSWHIWFTDEPQGQVYYNNAGIMMDRNLGATSATAGEVGALGLLYQWGRKDPFLGSSSISESVDAASTGTWTIASGGAVDLLEANPTTFYTDTYLPKGSWDSEKTAYDPCPAGWRVPEGGDAGVWATAVGSSDSFTLYFDHNYYGHNLTGVFGEDASVWLPVSGYRHTNYSDVLSNVGSGGYCWSCTPYEGNSRDAYSLHFQSSFVDPSYSNVRDGGCSVRCLKE